MKYKLKNLNVKILSDAYYRLSGASYDFLNLKGAWEHQEREVFDRGHGAVVLLYNLEKKSVILIEQFRMPVYMNDPSEAMMLEACAGMLDDNDPKKAIVKEILEETGHAIPESEVKKVFEAYSSPGVLTEKLHYFIAPYTADQKVAGGGGVVDETENIVVHEIAFAKAIQLMNDSAIKDAKTILLLQYAQLHIF